jgi:hypothetical protein
MYTTTTPRSDGHLATLVGGTLAGAGLVAAGLLLAFLAIETPLVAHLMPGAGAGSSSLSSAVLVWALAIVAGGSMLVSGADRLASTLVGIRARTRRPSAVAQALATLPGDIVVMPGVATRDDRPRPNLVVGTFGVAVVHEMASPAIVRSAGPSWEITTPHGWAPTEPPLERAARDADRVRYWLGQGDLDFVARVHAVLVAPDPSLPRSAGCAVITADQIPAWLVSLPRQRSLTDSRRARLLALVRAGVAAEDARRGW